MVKLVLTLYGAGMLTIILPCILPLVPIVLGVGLSGRRRARPLVTVLGMVASFVLFTFLAQLLLDRAVSLANTIRVAAYYTLVLFGVCFLTDRLRVRLGLAIMAALVFFWGESWLVRLLAPFLGVAAVVLGGWIATRMQQLGTGLQQGAEATLGRESLLATFIVGLTLGLVWVPCAGPALGFALALVRDEHGPKALGALTAYALGAATPLVLIGYGGQRIGRSARWLGRHSGRVKQFAGALFILSAVGLQYHAFTATEAWLVNHTGFGDLGTRIEERVYGRILDRPATPPPELMAPSSSQLPTLPRLGPAPEFVKLGPWYNSPPLTMASLRGKVVLVDFWTYSCINCIRTLPELRAYWAQYRDQPFVIVGIHSPEFVFERSPANVAAAIKRYQLTYPIAQDNELATWNAFGNRYWPAKYLIDAQGLIRYRHFGERGEQATQRAIRSLLAELGDRTPAPPMAARPAVPERAISPETYLDARSWPAFANAAGAPDGREHHYAPPPTLALDHYALGGDWQLVQEERQVLRSRTGTVRYRALAGEVNLVLGMEGTASPAHAEVSVDGQPGTRFDIVRHDLYNLYTGAYGEHEIAVRFDGKEVAAYDFTFGE